MRLCYIEAGKGIEVFLTIEISILNLLVFRLVPKKYSLSTRLMILDRAIDTMNEYIRLVIYEDNLPDEEVRSYRT